MCKCTPNIKTPWCGRQGCEMPKQPKKDISYVPVQMFVRFVRNSNENQERALLVARRDNGEEYTFKFDDIDGELENLVVSNFYPDGKN